MARQLRPIIKEFSHSLEWKELQHKSQSHPQEKNHTLSVESNKAVKTATKSNHHISAGLGQAALPRKYHEINGSSTVDQK